MVRLWCSVLVLAVACDSPLSDFVLREQPDDLCSRSRNTDVPSLLENTAAIVEGKIVAGESVASKDYRYTNYYLLDLAVHRGSVQPGVQPSSMILQMYGGQSPDGMGTGISHGPQLECGERYLLFLTSRTWRWHPLIASPIRVRREGGQTFLVDSTHAIGEVTRERFVRAESDPLYQRSTSIRPESCGVTGSTLVRTDTSAPSDALDVEAFLAEVAAIGVDVSGEFYGDATQWDEPIQGSPHCELERHYPGCEPHPGDLYTIPEEGACDEGFSCMKTSVRPEGASDRCGDCSEQIEVCVPMP